MLKIVIDEEPKYLGVGEKKGLFVIAGFGWKVVMPRKAIEEFFNTEKEVGEK